MTSTRAERAKGSAGLKKLRLKRETVRDLSPRKDKATDVRGAGVKVRTTGQLCTTGPSGCVAG